MPNGNLKVEVTCPQCNTTRLARGDVARKAEREGRELWCKPCRNQKRFDNKPHPRKGTGVVNDPDLKRTRSSFYKAKYRCKQGAKHHPAYENVEFRFKCLQDLIDEIGIRPEGKTLDRINGLGHYETGNVRWANTFEQAQNRMPRNYWQTQSK
jgi:hypothetical protein